jgi:ATP-dependent Clp protease ATP-binding subunit ClpA
MPLNCISPGKVTTRVRGAALKRVIQRALLDPLSLEILAGDFREGETMIADMEEGRLKFNKGA